MYASAIAAWFASIAVSAAGPEVSFQGKPSASRVGDEFRIAFAVSKPTDVEVAVLAAGGKVVRHLAAGVLGGENPPPSPLKAGLQQDMIWDGKDDLGQTARTGPFRIRVRAGLKSQFDGFLLSNPDASGPISALATGPAGTVYLFHHDGTSLPSHWGSKKLKVISRQGRHLRAILPFPADIAPEKIKPLSPFCGEHGALVPHIHHLRHLSFYPDPAGSFAPHQSPVVDSRGRVYWLVMGPRLACLDADGGVPYPTFLSDPLLPGIKNLRMASPYLYGRDTPALALSSDEKYLYLAGLGTGQHGKDKENKPLPCVFRIDLATRGLAEVFLGRLPDSSISLGAGRADGGGSGTATAGKSSSPLASRDASQGEREVSLRAPRGLAVAGGLVYVADRDANRILVFKEADRSLAGQIQVEDPQGVGVDPATGAVYVCAHTGRPNPNGKQTADLIKFDGHRGGKELCRLTLPKTGLNPNTGVHRIAVDASASPVRIWVPDIPYSPSRLACIEDTGERLVNLGDPRDTKTPWAEGPRDLSLDRLRGELYIKVSHQKWFRFEEATGRMLDPVDLARVYKYNLNMSDNGTQIVPHPDGSLVSLNWNRGLIRLDRKGNPTNWAGRDTDRIPFGGIMSFMERSLALLNADEMAVILPNTYRLREADKERARRDNRMHSVDVIGTDGQPKRTLIWQCTHGAVLRVDRRGNIYLAEPLKPVGRSYPAFFDGKLLPQTRSLTPQEGKDVFWNSYMYGSIVKFQPSGGAIWYGKDRKLSPSAVGQPPAELLARPTARFQAHLVYTPNVPAEVQGAEWVRFGFAPFALHSGSDTCMCEGAGFDIDLWGRVFYPNVGQFRVEVVDANNNFVGAMGEYGNQDSGGPNALVRKPPIPLAWPLSVVVSDTHAYVADTINRRVVRVRLGWAAEENCAIP